MKKYRKFRNALKDEMRQHTGIEVCARARTVDRVITLESVHYVELLDTGINIRHFPNYSLN